MSGLVFQQSIIICSALAASGGILEVFATAVLAYPASRSVEGFEWTDRQLKGCLAANIILQILASISGNLCATWFGPVAIVGPIFFAAQLLANLIVFWIVLGLEAFSREMQIGTYVIVVAVVLLIVNGPGSQDYGDTTFEELITQSYALIWASLLLGAMLFTGVCMTILDMHKQPLWFKYGVLLTARATGFSLNLSTGKGMVMPSSTFWLSMNIAIKIVSGMIYTGAIVIQSTAVEQKVFVPMNAAMIMLINALTGIIIWEDWRVVSSWVGYVCVFLLLALGIGLLLGDLGLLQETSPKTFMGARVSMVYKDNRREMLDRLKHFGGQLDLIESGDSSEDMEQQQQQQQKAPRRDSDPKPSLDINGSLSESRRAAALRRTMTLGVTNPSAPEPNSQTMIPRASHLRSQSDSYYARPSVRPPRPTMGDQRRSSVLFRPRTHQQAWMALYEAAGATSRRSSAQFQSISPLLSKSEDGENAGASASDRRRRHRTPSPFEQEQHQGDPQLPPPHYHHPHTVMTNGSGDKGPRKNNNVVEATPNVAALWMTEHTTPSTNNLQNLPEIDGNEHDKVEVVRAPSHDAASAVLVGTGEELEQQQQQEQEQGNANTAASVTFGNKQVKDEKPTTKD